MATTATVRGPSSLPEGPCPGEDSDRAGATPGPMWLDPIWKRKEAERPDRRAWGGEDLRGPGHPPLTCSAGRGWSSISTSGCCGRL